MTVGEILLSQQVTSSAAVQVLPLHLSVLSDGLGVSMTSGQDEGHNSEAVGAHSEVTILIYPRFQILVRSANHSNGLVTFKRQL